MTTTKLTSGNPIVPGVGLCDPHIRICNDRAYLYATHDKAANSSGFVMDDWWIHRAADSETMKGLVAEGDLPGALWRQGIFKGAW